MLKRFFHGVIQGLGFSISVVFVFSVWGYFVANEFISSEPMTIRQSSTTIPIDNNFPFIENFDELPIEEKINLSTAILVTTIEKNKDGKYQATVVEVLKKEEGVELYYDVGDIYEDRADYDEYEAKKRSVPKGFIVFMGGNPATMRYAVSYSGDRVGGLGNISLALLRKKCEK